MLAIRCAMPMILVSLAMVPAVRAQWFADDYCQASGSYQIAATRDGGCIAVGIDDRASSWSGALVKVDASGVPLWATAIDYRDDQDLLAVAEVADGYIAVGRDDDIFRIPRGLVLKLDLSGNLRWFRLGTGSPECVWRSAAATPDGGVVMSGHPCTDDSVYDLSVLKLDAAGNESWMLGYHRKLPTEPGGVGEGGCLLSMPDGSVIVGSTIVRSRVLGEENDDALLIKLDGDGSVRWQRAYGALYPVREEISALAAGDDGSIYAMGYAGAAASGYPFVLHADADGSLLWFRTLADPLADSALTGIAARAGGGCHVALGRAGPVSTLPSAIVAFSDQGDIVWQEYLTDTPVSYMASASGGPMIVGPSWFMAHLDQTGRARTACLSYEASAVTATPSPVEDWVADRAFGNLTWPYAIAAATAVSLPTTHVCAPCAYLDCREIVVSRSGPCAADPFTLHAEYLGGEGAVVVEWDVGSDGTIDAAGNDASVGLPLGTTSVTAQLHDECAFGMQQCSLETPVVVDTVPPSPSEVSDVLAGAPPLRMARAPERLSVEAVAGASEYGIYAGWIGRWFEPIAAAGSECGRSGIDLGDGTIAFDVQLGADAWVIVTARNACSEGPAGRTSSGVERSMDARWIPCP